MVGVAKACPYGLGSCLVLTTNTERNRGRKFFRCPNRQDMAEKDESEGRCPACRTVYDKDRIVGMAANCERLVQEVNMEKKHKSQKAKVKGYT